jgi:pimeloyl-ACP methyl ester carboxylesterase
MRPDWEVVTATVMDYVSSYAADRPDLELDLDRIAIAGASLGGYFALRGAADARFKACIAVDPIYDLWDFVTKHVSPILSLWNRGWVPDTIVNNMVWLGMQLSFQMKWEIVTSARFLGVSTPAEILRAMQQYTLRKRNGCYLDQLECAVFVTGAADSLYLDVDNHTTRVFDGLKHQQKQIWVADSPGQGSLQAKMGAMALCNQRVFEFLDKQFDINRRKAL